MRLPPLIKHIQCLFENWSVGRSTVFFFHLLFCFGAKRYKMARCPGWVGLCGVPSRPSPADCPASVMQLLRADGLCSEASPLP